MSYLDADGRTLRVFSLVTDGYEEGVVLGLRAGMALVDWGVEYDLIWEEPWDLYVLV